MHSPVFLSLLGEPYLQTPGGAVHTLLKSIKIIVYQNYSSRRYRHIPDGADSFVGVISHFVARYIDP